ncbi:hypothetical protein INT47_002289 [Mucor saturninus]|uniref:SCP domain-containing protein n=1 Tax=Mucor saturninus TaxID=64648 RepID=A0A8H7UYE9_9FUNG|nr:hypothetical protein INT47_002289 [Mucor saturninus]
MLYPFSILLLLFVVLCVAASEVDNSIEQRNIIIALHKKLRHNHKDTSALKWDTILAFQSKQYVKKCDFNRKSDISGFANLIAIDNVASGFKNWNQTINAWYKGNEYYDYDHPGYTDAAATFITMVWKDTERIGCASQECPSGTLYRCLYSPSIPIHLILDEKEYESNVATTK